MPNRINGNDLQRALRLRNNVQNRDRDALRNLRPANTGALDLDREVFRRIAQAVTPAVTHTADTATLTQAAWAEAWGLEGPQNLRIATAAHTQPIPRAENDVTYIRVDGGLHREQGAGAQTTGLQGTGEVFFNTEGVRGGVAPADGQWVGGYFVGKAVAPPHKIEIKGDHPSHHLLDLSKEFGIEKFNLRIYKGPYEGSYPATLGSIEEIPMVVKATELISKIAKIQLARGSDIAVQSKVKIGEEFFHIPFIDFIEKDLKVIEEALDFSSPDLGMDRDDFKIYFSGTSYHAYGKFLMDSNEAFPNFSSKLLLVRHPKLENTIVDPRWIGHSQIKNSYSLRITNNKKTHMPNLIK